MVLKSKPEPRFNPPGMIWNPPGIDLELTWNYIITTRNAPGIIPCTFPLHQFFFTFGPFQVESTWNPAEFPAFQAGLNLVHLESSRIPCIPGRTEFSPPGFLVVHLDSRGQCKDLSRLGAGMGT